MREILFRGKVHEKLLEDQWVYGYYAIKGKGTGAENHVIYQSTFDLGYRFYYFADCRVKADTVGQYTGQKDINGTPIFEGDIVRVVSSDEIAVVKWDEIESRFYFDTDEYGICIISEAEVLGNVYDNPELLGGADNA